MEIGIYDKNETKLKNKLRDDFNLELKEVENIPKTESAKVRFLDQQLEIRKYLRH